MKEWKKRRRIRFVILCLSAECASAFSCSCDCVCVYLCVLCFVCCVTSLKRTDTLWFYSWLWISIILFHRYTLLSILSLDRSVSLSHFVYFFLTFFFACCMCKVCVWMRLAFLCGIHSVYTMIFRLVILPICIYFSHTHAYPHPQRDVPPFRALII